MGGAFTWTPAESQGPGVYYVTVRATDNGSPPLDDVEMIAITVNEINTPPETGDDSYTLSEDTLLSQPGPEVLTNNTDDDLPGFTLNAIQDNPPLHGALTLNSDGSFIHTPMTERKPIPVSSARSCHPISDIICR